MAADKEANDKFISGGRFGKFDRLLARIAAVATVVGLLAAVYFGIKTREQKEFEVAYTGKLSLISPDAGPSGRIRIYYLDKTVTNLTKVVAKLSNSGALPIERKDIEEPLTFMFTNASILDARVVDTHPANLQVEVTFTNSSVKIGHGLLNPGDNLQVEMLVDGNSGWPSANFRVSGVREPTILFAQKENLTLHAAYIKLPKPAEFSVLILGTASIAILVIGGIVAAFMAVKPCFQRVPSLTERLNHPGIDPKRVLNSTVQELRRDLQGLLIVARANDNVPTWIDNAPILAQQIEKNAPKPFLQSFAQPTLQIAQMVCNEMRTKVPKTLANYFYVNLPTGADNQVKELVAGLKFESNISYSEFFELAKAKAREALTAIDRVQKFGSIDKDNIIISVILLAVGLPLALILANSWHILLNQ